MIKIIGHRGASGYELENTILSFTKAVELGVDMIEIDVQATRDNKLVVFHDNTLDRLTNHKGYLNNYTLKEIGKIELLNGSKIIEFKEVCKFCSQKNIELFIEIKSSGIGQSVYEEAMMDQEYEKFIIWSFNHNEISDLPKLYDSKIQTSIIFESYPVGLKEYISQINCDYVSVGFESVTDSMIDELKTTNKKMIFWTIDLITEAKKAIGYSPYAIISNFPDIIKQAIRSSIPSSNPT